MSDIKMLPDNELPRIIEPVLKAQLSPVGFLGASIQAETDYDGAPIIQIRAKFKDGKSPSAKVIADAVHEIRNELLSRGEERFVFLANDFKDQNELGGDT